MAHQEYCILALIVAALALYAFLRDRIQWSMWMLFIASLTLRVFIAIQDPYLHDWDERYHGLVAKHFIDHPGIPTLRDRPLLPYEEDQWHSNHVWLHKQPVFLWQMAVSMYFLKDDVFAARLPSILMGALMTLLIFRMASLTIHPRAGFIAAFFHTLCFFQIEQTSGVIGMDHNDIAFSFYITVSIWAFLEFLVKQKWQWVLMIGLSAGLAVLNKWLPGMIVYGGWCMWLLFDPLARSEGKKRWLAFLISGFVACLVFIPWQLYIMDRWPNLSAYVYYFNRLHIFMPLEGHAGDDWFHFRMYGTQYGYWSAAFLLVGAIELMRHRRHPAHVYAVFFPILATYILDCGANKIVCLCLLYIATDLVVCGGRDTYGMAIC